MAKSTQVIRFHPYQGDPRAQGTQTSRKPEGPGIGPIDSTKKDLIVDEATPAVGAVPSNTKPLRPAGFQRSADKDQYGSSQMTRQSKITDFFGAAGEQLSFTVLRAAFSQHEGDLPLKIAGMAPTPQEESPVSQEPQAGKTKEKVRFDTALPSSGTEKRSKDSLTFVKHEPDSQDTGTLTISLMQRIPRLPQSFENEGHRKEASDKVKLPAIFSLAPAKRKWKKAPKDSDREYFRVGLKTNATIMVPKMEDEDPPELTTLAQISSTRPEWYLELGRLSKNNATRNSSAGLQHLKTLVNNYMKETGGNKHKNDLEAIRSCLLQMSLLDFNGKEKQVIKGSMLLIDGTFKKIDDNSPTDVANIARWLSARWWKGDTQPDLMRGIKRALSKNDQNRTHIFYNLDSEYPFRVSCKYTGEGPLYNGQWWPLQICANRDGAHGEMEAGIAGTLALGAVSIVLSGAGYADIDEGDTLQYCGTTASTAHATEPSYSTKLMRTSLERGSPVRVLRSAKAANSRYRPSRGLRYDGLYTITKEEIIEPSTLLYRFILERVQGQQPICWQGPSKRPHQHELDAWENDIRLRKYIV